MRFVLLNIALDHTYIIKFTCLINIFTNIYAVHTLLSDNKWTTQI